MSLVASAHVCVCPVSSPVSSFFYVKWPYLASPLYTHLECHAATGACIDVAKQAALNEFIKEKTKFESLFFYFSFSMWILLSFDHPTNRTN